MDSSTYETLAPDVLTASKTVGREWADVISTDDAEQEIWLRILDSSQNYGRDLMELEKPARVSVITEIGHQIGMKYRDDYELFSGNYVYGTRQVRDMLERDALAGMDEDSHVPLWELPESVIEQINRTDKETVTERIDLFLGMKSLQRRNARYAGVIVAEYVLFMPIHSHSQELTRAVDGLTRDMNGAHRKRYADYTDGPGTRDAVTNARGQVQTSLIWNGDLSEGRR